MEKQLSMLDMIIETHSGLERQGPGSLEATIKALSFVDDLGKNARILDLACGTGGQTMVIAQNISGDITGLDIIPEFIYAFNENAKKHNLQDRMRGVIGSMEDLDFEEEAFDLIWSEGAIDNIGFEKGIGYWNGFLAQGGFIAVTCPTWLTDECPDEIEKFWGDAVGGLSTTNQNIAAIQRTGYRFVAAFTLPDTCWTENYFAPRDAADKALLEKYPGDKTVEAYLEGNKYERELFSRFSQHYGYVFYIAKKIEAV